MFRQEREQIVPSKSESVRSAIKRHQFNYGGSAKAKCANWCLAFIKGTNETFSDVGHLQLHL